MNLAGKKLGFALTASYCTLDRVLTQIKELNQEGVKIQPILSSAIQDSDTRFGSGKEWEEKITNITANKAIKTIVEAEPIGPKQLLDVLVVAPCTGNTLAKIANGITDTPVTMAVKAQLRNKLPVVLAIATNDALGNNAKNIGSLLNIPYIYFVPLGQDDPTNKANSLVARMDLIIETVRYSLKGKQLQPVIIEYKGV